MEETIVAIRFNEILKEELGNAFVLQPLPLDPDFALKYANAEDKRVYIKNEFFACPKRRHPHGGDGFCRIYDGALWQHSARR